jgi:hypothetical protein
MNLNNFLGYFNFSGAAAISLENKVKLTAQEIAEIHEGRLKDTLFDLRVSYSDAIRLHSVGDLRLVQKLLQERYPGEPEEIRQYKLKNWKPITKTFFYKIVNTIAKFQKAEDFNIIYENNAVRDYCEQEIKNYGSVYNWFFTLCLPALLQEPNGVILISPPLSLEEKEKNEKDSSEKRYFPELFVFSAQHVIFKNEEFVLIRNPKNNLLYYYIDKEAITLIEIETEQEGYYKRKVKKINYTLLYEHNFNLLPVISLGGIPSSIENPDIYESLINGVTPFWEQALVEFSELTAGIKQHVFPDKWRYLMGSCNECGGTGKLTITRGGSKITDTCYRCKGSGDPPTGMFAEILIRQPTGLEEKPPIPPVGYVKKDFDAIEFLERRYKSLIYEGLRAINMEFLTDTPLNQSGRAKEMDRMETNAFLSTVARHSIENILQPCYAIIAMWLFPDTDKKTAINNLAPKITTPVQFDYVISDADANLKNAKDSGIKGAVYAELEKRYINSKFENFIYEKTYLLLVNELDPLRGYSVDEKIELYNNGCITQLDLVCSVNLPNIIRKALETTYGYSFAKKKYSEQIEFIYSEAKRLLETIDNDISKQKEKYVLQDNSALLSDSEQGDENELPFDA